MNSKLDATITNFIGNYSQLNMFRTMLPADSIAGASYHKL